MKCTVNTMNLIIAGGLGLLQPDDSASNPNPNPTRPCILLLSFNSNSIAERLGLLQPDHARRLSICLAYLSRSTS